MRDSHDKPTVPRAFQDLTDIHGPLMSGGALHRALGFQTGAGFRQAFKRGRLPIETFRLQGRRDRFARTADVAAWLSQIGAIAGAEGPQTQGDGAMT